MDNFVEKKCIHIKNISSKYTKILTMSSFKYLGYFLLTFHIFQIL